MNMKINPNIEELRLLVLRYDDSECNHNLWVSFGGEVHISKIPDEEAREKWERNHEAAAKFYYTYLKGNGCVGKRAANDTHLQKLLSDLQKDWDKGVTGHVVPAAD